MTIADTASAVREIERPAASPVDDSTESSDEEVLLPLPVAEELFEAAEKLGVVAGLVEFEAEEAEEVGADCSHALAQYSLCLSMDRSLRAVDSSRLTVDVASPLDADPSPRGT